MEMANTAIRRAIEAYSFIHSECTFNPNHANEQSAKLLSHIDLQTRYLISGYSKAVRSNGIVPAEIVDLIFVFCGFIDLMINRCFLNKPDFDSKSDAVSYANVLLYIAALSGCTDVVRGLLSNPDIDIDRRNFSGVTALWAACYNNHSEIVELLLHPRNVIVELQTDHNPSKSNRKKKKRREKRQGANPNLAKYDGCTPLWIAASRGNSQSMEPLINYGADLNKPDRSQGATPLFVACQNGKKPAVDLLLAANADVNRPRSGDGTTPLIIAAHNGHSSIVDVLSKSGADPMQANTTGHNALGCAAVQGHLEIVKLVYQHLLNLKNPQEIVDFVNAGDGVNGWTPLHLACMGGHENVIKYLIERVKVDIFKKDYENKSGLERAWQNGHQTIVSWLSQLEASCF